MNKIIIVYETDNWHSRASMNVIAVCTNKKKAISLIKKYAKEQGEKISSDDLYLLNTINQTQGFSGSGEFHMEEHEKNVLL